MATYPTSKPTAELAQPSTDDLDVWAAALADFLERPESDCFWVLDGRTAADRTSIAITRMTLEANGLTSPDQFRGERAKDNWVVPSELQQSIVQRNASTVSLDALAGRDKRFVVIPEFTIDDAQAAATQPLDRWNWHDKHLVKLVPSVKAYVNGWLPGFSADGNTAIVRFWFGPSPHGSVATYLLVRENGDWHVIRRDFAFFA